MREQDRDTEAVHLTSQERDASKTALPELPAPVTHALIQGAAMQGSEYRRLADSYEPGCAQYSADQMRAYALAACEAATGAHKPDELPVDVPALVASHARLVEVLLCAKNVLFLLQPEVKALGHAADKVADKLDAALASIPKEIV
jgi:hypothetical protein